MNDNLSKEDFIRQYAAEIAQTFRTQEETPPQTKLEDSISELYRSLCFDEPILDYSQNFTVTVSGLCRQLLNKKYAISDRLVNGILYLTKTKKDDSSDKKTNSPESIALAKIVFCVLVQIPLQICQNFENTDSVRQYLGSYKGNLNAIQESKDINTATNDAVIQRQVDQLSEALGAGATLENVSSPLPQQQQEDDENSVKEVWAAESDPSDYDYGEGAPEYPQQHSFQHQDDWLDPQNLSKPDPALTIDQARLALGSLLKQAQYNVLEPLFSLSKKEIEKFTQDLTQLVLVLLQPQNPLGSFTEDASFQNAILSPLWVLRDAGIHFQTLTPTYLDLLQTLLAMDQAHLQDLSGKPAELCTASIVGLSALSSWCSMTEISIPTTITYVLDAMNDISHVVERALEQYRDNLRHSLVPIMELLSGISFHEAKANRGGVNSNNIAQTLLNSGFLRLLLTLALDKNDEAQLNQYYSHALWGLSVYHPKIVGKYVARYPGIADFVRTYTCTTESSAQECISCILWNGFGFVQSDGQQTQAPRVIWKNAAAAKQQTSLPLTQDECKQVCQKAWASIIKIIEMNLVNFQSTSPESTLNVLQEWERMLSQIEIMSPTFCELLPSEYLEDISKALVTLSQQELPEEVKEDAGAEENENDPDNKLKSPKSNHQRVVSKARKILKQYTLFFQGSAKGSSKTD